MHTSPPRRTDDRPGTDSARDRATAPFERLVRAMRRQARASGHRATLVLSGDRTWATTLARRAIAALPEATPTWLGDRPRGAGSGMETAAARQLGQDLALLILDAHDGFDPDAFGAATGALRGGGLLILLTPDFADWPTRDPAAERISVWPEGRLGVGGRFLRRLAGVLEDASAPGLIHLAGDDPASVTRALAALDAGCTSPSTSEGSASEDRDARPRARAATPDQARAVAAILAVARGRARRPLVIRAHRGRGKSAALGLAAGRLLCVGDWRILVTAPRRSAVDALFVHARAVLDDPVPDWIDAETIRPPSGQGARGRPAGPALDFIAPADLLAERPDADLLLIDEAAGIPAPMLERLLAHYPRVVFATTVHGYEGTGRGFDLRFRATLDRLTPEWRALELMTPIRWSAGDPLETLTFRALLLDAAPASIDRPSAQDLDAAHCERLDRDRLATDEPRLRQLFGLLVLAHYQTRPMDLRMLLDGPNVRVYAIMSAGRVIATALAAAEGGFDDPALRAAIFEGRRRPRGHLLPQTLSTHAGLAEAPALRHLRILRIAVHPELTRLGLGRRLLRRIGRDGRAEGFDLLGASFGASPELIRFWDRCGFRPAQLGTSRNAASGEHALVVLRRLSTRGWRFTARAQTRLEARLPVLLSGPLRGLDPSVAVSLIAAIRVVPPALADGASPPERARELDGFIAGHRALDATLPLLAELTRRGLGPALRAGRIADAEAAVLIAVARQLRPITTLVATFGTSGREALVQSVRRASATLRDAIEARSDPILLDVTAPGGAVHLARSAVTSSHPTLTDIESSDP